jgi:ATP-dependent DNA ligase
MTFVAFDLLELNGEPIAGLPFEERRRRLKELVKPGDLVRISEATPSLVRLYEKVCSLGGEGVVVKTRNHAYQPGVRSKDWLKAKAPEFEDELHVVGLQAGEGKRERLGALILGRIDEEGNMIYVCRAGSGLTEEQIDKILKAAPHLARPTCPLLVAPQGLEKPILTWLDLGITAIIRFTRPLEKEGPKRTPRFPIIQNIRLLEAE